MSRRRTRKLKPKTRKTTGRVNLSRHAGAFMGMLAAAVAPLRPLAASVASRAWHSRNVRRGAGVAGGALALAAISWVMLANLGQEQRYTIDPARIELAAEPGWATGELASRVKHEIEEDLRAGLADMGPASAFDEGVMEQVAQSLARNAWVARVVRIERRFPAAGDDHARLLPVLELRRPALMVESGECYRLVDGEGVVLPLEVRRDTEELRQFRSQLAAPLRIARGVTGDAPVAGEVWNNEQLTAALSMERVVRRARLDQSLPIDVIELVSVPQKPDERGRVHYPPGGGVVLVPDPRALPDTRVIWGRPPVHASTLELSANEKLDKLMKRLANPDSQGGNIDLRGRNA